MGPELVKFIKENKDLLNQNTEESWYDFYAKAIGSVGEEAVSELTQTLLNIKIDPLDIISFVPRYYMYNNKKLKSFKVPSQVEIIGAGAFEGCENLTDIEIPNSILNIGNWAFKDCKSLIDVKMPSYMEAIGERAFNNCYNLKHIEIPEGVSELGTATFKGCNTLTQIELSKSIIKLWNHVFDECNNLNKVILNKEIKQINNYVFSDCSNLKELIYKGTKKEWDQILKLVDWKYHSAIEKIICTDGEITL